jgi:soluble lytic murein transglycosylase-like protein
MNHRYICVLFLSSSALWSGVDNLYLMIEQEKAKHRQGEELFLEKLEKTKNLNYFQSIFLGLHKKNQEFFDGAKKESKDETYPFWLYFQSLAFFERGEYEKARDILKTEPGAAFDLWPALKKRWIGLMCDTLMALGAGDEFLAWFDKNPRKSQAHWAYAGNIYKHKNDDNGYILCLEESLGDYPFTSISRDAFLSLKKKEGYQFSQKALEYLAANHTYDSNIKKEVLNLIPPMGLGEKVDLLLKLRFFEEAFGLAKKSPRSEKNLFILGKQASKLGFLEEAASYYRLYRKVHSSYPVSPLELLGDVASYQKNYKKAREIYRVVSEKNPNATVKWHYFWMTYRVKGYKEALALLGKKKIPPRDQNRPEGLGYWQGRLYERTGQKTKALSIYKQLLQGRGFGGIYGDFILASHPNLGKRSFPLFSVKEDRESLLISQVREAGFLSFAQELFYLNKKQKNLEAFWGGSHPQAYGDIVGAACGRLGVDPHLVWSIMRAESRYFDQALSPVGARGLLQLMPYTAAKISNRTGDWDFTPQDLYDPYVNIFLGAWYIRELLTYFNGEGVLAVAAYNAGPQVVTVWRHRWDGFTVDEFMESIPYKETRNYVKEVFHNLAIYKKDSPNDLKKWFHRKPLAREHKTMEMF